MRLTHPIISYEDLHSDYTKKNSSEINSSERLRFEVLQLIEDYKDTILKLEAAMVRYNQQLIRDNPPIGLMTLKRQTGKGEHEYLSARVMYPLMGNRVIDIRLQVGKKSEYPNIDSVQTKKILRDRIRTLLNEYLKEKGLD
jgi:hypothetical protein